MMIEQKAPLFSSLGALPGAHSKSWINLEATDQALRADRKLRACRRKRKFPQVLVSIEILPAEIVTDRPAGIGRGAPNLNPFLPEPKRPLPPEVVFLAFISLWVSCADACLCCCIDSTIPHWSLQLSLLH